MENKRKDITIIILPIILFLGILFLGTLRIKRKISIWPEMDVVYIIFYIIWIIAESKISKKDYHAEEKINFDFGTCHIYALGQGLIFLTALWFRQMWREPSLYLFLPFTLFCVGISFRLWSIKTLGECYSHKVCKIRGHKVIDFGPYKYIRHPAYTGMILANIGITIFFYNWVTAFCFIIIFLLSLILRIRVEEKMLFDIDGYSSYALNRKRLFPGVW